MTSREFTIPLDKDELVRTHFGEYGHRDVVPLQLISREINGITQQQLTSSDPVDLIQAKQDVFLSIIIHGNKVEIAVLLRSFGRILKLVQNLIAFLEKKTEQVSDLDLEQDEKAKLLYTIKLAAYIMSSTLCLIEEQIADTTNSMDNVGRRKKNAQKSDFEEEWEHQREKAMEILHRWLQLPIKNLWNPPIVEDTFVSTVSQICYKILEKTKDIRSKNVRNLIFQILGLLVKKYSHGIACVVRIIQLAKFHEALAAPIGAGVVLMVNECGCSGLIKEIAKEIGISEPGEADARNFSAFLESIAATQADIILPILDNIMDYLDNECYVMRNCAIGVMGLVVANVLKGEDLSAENRAKRDECLENLEEHILDCNAYVRSKVLQTWQKLCCEGAIPLSRQNNLVKATVLRLEDKSANVRRQALQLLRAVLQSNPFAAKMDKEDFTRKLDIAKADLKQSQTDIYHTAGAEEEKEELWLTQKGDIETAINKFVEKHSSIDEDEEVTEEEIDIKETFDKIQRYILKDECSKAVKYLYKLFMHGGFAKEMKNVSVETRKEALLLFMYKIFIHSSAKPDQEKETSNKKALGTDQEELKKLDQIKKQKLLVNYLQNCLTFSTEIEKTIPIVEKLLYSVNAGDAVEACSFLGAAYQFQIDGALAGVRKALFQIFSRDQSVRDNLAIVYKEIYLDHSNQGTNRGKALQSVKSLIQLLDGMLPGQSTALSKLIVLWRNNGELDVEALKVMWEMFSLKLPNTTPLESRSALMLLTMAAQAESNIITDNLDVLIKVGLGPRAKTDLLLARDTCRAFLAIKQDTTDIEKAPIRFENEHEIFKEVCGLLKESFFDEQENGYISFATDAINVIYHLADMPPLLLQDVLCYVGKRSKLVRSPDSPSNTVEVPSCYISRFLFLIGHTGIREMVHLDQTVYKELKRRNAVKEKKKEIRARLSNIRGRKSLNVSAVSTVSNASSIMGSAQRSMRANKNDDENEDMEGAVADDADAEHINMCLEKEILAPGGFFSKFLPLIFEVCQHPEKYPDETLQAHGALALSKLMTISSEFCENNLQLFVTILEKSPYPNIRANILIGLADLMTRFPNQIEPWTSHIYGRLKDDDLNVRSTCVRMLSNLILGEMIRVKGQVAQLALCMVDENDIIRTDTRNLFKDLSQKGNALYNVMPDILSCLSDSDLNLSEKNFQDIIKYILGLLQKDRQVDSIIEKLCSRFKLATTERQWRDLSYCLSLLKFSAKGIRILIKDLPLLKEKIHNDDVRKALTTIIEQAKRRPDAKIACQELEDKIKELVDSLDGEEGEQQPVDPDTQAMPPPTAPVPKSVRTKKKVRRTRKDEDDEDDDEDEENISMNNSRSTRRGRSSSVSKEDTTTQNSSSDEEEMTKTPRKNLRKSLRTPTRKDTPSRKESTPTRGNKTPRSNATSSQDDTPTQRSSRRREAASTPSSGKRTRSARS